MMRQLILTAVLGPLAGAFAQSQAPLTLRVNTQLVEINAVVTDGHGNPVADLKPGDFEIYDKGKKQEIKVFHVEDQLTACCASAYTWTQPGLNAGISSLPSLFRTEHRAPETRWVSKTAA